MRLTPACLLPFTSRPIQRDDDGFREVPFAPLLEERVRLEFLFFLATALTRSLQTCPRALIVPSLRPGTPRKTLPNPVYRTRLHMMNRGASAPFRVSNGC